MQSNNDAACVSEYSQLWGFGVGLYLARKGNPFVFLLWDRHVVSEEKIAAKEMYVALEESSGQISLSNSTLWLPITNAENAFQKSEATQIGFMHCLCR